MIETAHGINARKPLMVVSWKNDYRRLLRGGIVLKQKNKTKVPFVF